MGFLQNYQINTIVTTMNFTTFTDSLKYYWDLEDETDEFKANFF